MTSPTSISTIFKKKLFLLPLFLIFALALTLRSWRIDYPLADWHSWRQADTASVTRNFVRDGFTPLYPHFDTLYTLNWRYAEKNPDRLFLAEFPLYNILVYPFYRLFGINIVFSRLVSIFFSSLSIFPLFGLAYSLTKKRSLSYLAAFFFAVLPYNVYYGRTVMPDPLHVFFQITTLFLFVHWLDKKKLSWGILAAISLALTLLTKPYALYLGLPIAALIIHQFRFKTFKKWPQLLLLSLISLLPFAAWRYHLSLHPEGQFDTAWLINSTKIRFTGAFFRWIIFERLNRLILATGGFVLFFAGLIAPKLSRQWTLYLSWLLGLSIFICFIATGNITHDYYQLPLVPIACLLMAEGSVFILKLSQNIFQRLFNLSIVLTLIALMLAFGWYEVKGFFNVNDWAMVHAGQKADEILPSDALVIAPYNRDPAFLYQTNRLGWSFLPFDLDTMIQKGATHLVSTSLDDQTNEAMKKGVILTQTPEYVIVQLPLPSPTP